MSVIGELEDSRVRERALFFDRWQAQKRKGAGSHHFIHRSARLFSFSTPFSDSSHSQNYCIVASKHGKREAEGMGAREIGSLRLHFLTEISNDSPGANICCWQKAEMKKN